jgi:transposase
MQYDIKEREWEAIKGLLPGREGSRGTKTDNRAFLRAVMWIARTGAPWRSLPKEYGKWSSVHKRFLRWAKIGLWERIFNALAVDRDDQWIMLDTTLIRAHQHAAGAKKMQQLANRSNP